MLYQGLGGKLSIRWMRFVIIKHSICIVYIYSSNTEITSSSYLRNDLRGHVGLWQAFETYWEPRSRIQSVPGYGETVAYEGHVVKSCVLTTVPWDRPEISWPTGQNKLSSISEQCATLALVLPEFLDLTQWLLTFIYSWHYLKWVPYWFTKK